MRKAWIGVAVVAAVTLVGGLYARQSVKRLALATGRSISLSACHFQLSCERAEALGMSLPFPQISCDVDTDSFKGTFFWVASRNQWLRAEASSRFRDLSGRGA